MNFTRSELFPLFFQNHTYSNATYTTLLLTHNPQLQFQVFLVESFAFLYYQSIHQFYPLYTGIITQAIISPFLYIVASSIKHSKSLYVFSRQILYKNDMLLQSFSDTIDFILRPFSFNSPQLELLSHKFLLIAIFSLKVLCSLNHFFPE